MRAVDFIVVHHSASRRTIKAATIKRWHLAKGWSDIGYHYIIEAEGNIALGRPLSSVGAHAKGANLKSLGICVVGDNTKDERRWTEAQWFALEDLIAALRLVYGKPLKVFGHREVGSTPTECPGVEVKHL